ncbi:hypothetical protein VP01_326g5 [Puccinia sorghi]|uniref:Uncharacterized protein n=1 Tax=Puccinia sorghi TaxID=27349 RepID=A0A0L6UYQ1_9BASI|nr:hypothetical protein VP01_326g5 [Puccinia sorghi]
MIFLRTFVHSPFSFFQVGYRINNSRGKPWVQPYSLLNPPETAGPYKSLLENNAQLGKEWRRGKNNMVAKVQRSDLAESGLLLNQRGSSASVASLRVEAQFLDKFFCCRVSFLCEISVTSMKLFCRLSNKNKSISLISIMMNHKISLICISWSTLMSLIIYFFPFDCFPTDYVELTTLDICVVYLLQVKNENQFFTFFIRNYLCFNSFTYSLIVRMVAAGMTKNSIPNRLGIVSGFSYWKAMYGFSRSGCTGNSALSFSFETIYNTMDLTKTFQDELNRECGCFLSVYSINLLYYWKQHQQAIQTAHKDFQGSVPQALTSFQNTFQTSCGICTLKKKKKWNNIQCLFLSQKNIKKCKKIMDLYLYFMLPSYQKNAFDDFFFPFLQKEILMKSFGYNGQMLRSDKMGKREETREERKKMKIQQTASANNGPPKMDQPADTDSPVYLEEWSQKGKAKLILGGIIEKNNSSSHHPSSIYYNPPSANHQYQLISISFPFSVFFILFCYPLNKNLNTNPHSSNIKLSHLSLLLLVSFLSSCLPLSSAFCLGYFAYHLRVWYSPLFFLLLYFFFFIQRLRQKGPLGLREFQINLSRQDLNLYFPPF